MTGKVIQGFFLGGQPKLASVQPRMAAAPPIQAKTAGPAPATAFVSRPPGPPIPAFGARAPGPPAPAFASRTGAMQRHGAGNAFAVDSGALGLASVGGKPLPDSVRGQMEVALGADFSNVRVHVGPQAERIGAIAFTVGSDIYFAPGRYQPDTVQGQQLLGHELTHVVQQRAGRVRNPLGTGLAVVQDHALEAEADRLGQRAAAYRAEVQAKLMPGAVQPSAPVRISPPVSAGPGSYRLTAGAGGRQVGSVIVHARDKGAVEVTDLGVDQTARGHGIGQMLVASAAKTGLQFGRSKVTLAAQDKGSGHLTQWYKAMGFTLIGVNQRGFPQLEAPISRVLASVAQRQKTVSAVDRTGEHAASKNMHPHPKMPINAAQRMPLQIPLINLPRAPSFARVAQRMEDNQKMMAVGEQGPMLGLGAAREDGDRREERGARFQYSGNVYGVAPQGEAGPIGRPKRSYFGHRVTQVLRWFSTLLFKRFGGIEIQCYFFHGYIYISSNKDSVNEDIRRAIRDTGIAEEYNYQLTNYLLFDCCDKEKTPREARHLRKLWMKRHYNEASGVYEALYFNKLMVTRSLGTDWDGLHAERRIRIEIGQRINAEFLGGVKRPCLVCQIALELKQQDTHTGLLFPGSASLLGMDELLKIDTRNCSPKEKQQRIMEGVLEHAEKNEIFSHVTIKSLQKTLEDAQREQEITTGYGSESDTDQAWG